LSETQNCLSVVFKNVFEDKCHFKSFVSFYEKLDRERKANTQKAVLITFHTSINFEKKEFHRMWKANQNLDGFRLLWDPTNTRAMNTQKMFSETKQNKSNFFTKVIYRPLSFPSYLFHKQHLMKVLLNDWKT
jgi:hypothetical protein